MLSWLGKKRPKPHAEGELMPEPGIREALLSQRPSDILSRWARTGRLRGIMPDLDALRAIPQLPAHKDNAFVHTMKVVDASDPTPVRRWAGLLHDIGKGPTFIETPDGRSRFFEHDRIGAEMVPEIMSAAGEDAELIEQVQRLVALHMRPISYNEEWTDAAVRRLVEEASEGRGEEGWRDLLALAHADLRGYLPEPIDRGLWVLQQLEAHRDRLAEQDAAEEMQEALEPRSPLNGHELLALTDRPPGPWINALKDYLAEEARAGRLYRTDKEKAREVAL
ncbi:MAG TPA: HD domain-containing protein, partial [Chloroflexia bacterium]|nr:HD domain-containing protein [Chloroflexia bacterium]